MSDFSYQLYSSRNFGPIDQTLAMLAKQGYTMVEGYGPLYDDPAQTRRLLEAAGLRMPTGHFAMDLVEANPNKALEIAREIGIGTIYVPYLAEDERPSSGDEWRSFAARLAEAGKPILDAGLGFGWHNHDFELVACEDGTVPLDAIAEAGVNLELDVAWVVRGGADPLAYIEKYAEQITAAHVKDIAPAGEKADEDGWADVGHGTLDWAGYMAALRHAGTQVFVMEHDNPSDDARFAANALAAIRNH